MIYIRMEPCVQLYVVKCAMYRKFELDFIEGKLPQLLGIDKIDYTTRDRLGIKLTKA